MSVVDESAPLFGYVAKFKDGVKQGPVAQFYYRDTPEGRRQADEQARRIDQDGYSVYSCIGKLLSQERNKDNVGALEEIVLDLDLRAMAESREQVIERVRNLPLPPYEIRDSGGGLHAIWKLHEPLVDKAGLEQAESVMKRLARLLAGDPMPTHCAALLRHPGTHNSKYGERRECRVIENNGSPCDISEFDDMFDLYGDTPLLHYRENTSSGNGGAAYTPGAAGDPVDVTAELASIKFGAIHNTWKRCMASLLGRGDPVQDTIEAILAATEASPGCQADPAKDSWKQGLCELAVWFLRQDPTHVLQLPPEVQVAWHQKIVVEGKRPGLVHDRRTGLQLRGYERREKPPHTAEPSPNPQPQQPPAATAAPPPVHIYPRPFSCFDFTKIPQREWLYGGHYMRSIASATIGPGGSGKSSLDLVESVAMATARNLLGEQPTERLKVWYHNGEDPLRELERRVAAICVYYKIDPHELDGYFFCTSGVEMPIKIAGGNGEVKLNHATAAAIIAGIRDRDVDVLTLDPLITLHSLAEAENHKMDPVLREFARVANDTNCAIELAHHTRKKVTGQDDYTTADARGASAIIDAVRSARTLNGLNNDDAKMLGIDDAIERLSYFRVDKGKANMTRRSAANFYRLVGQELPNGVGGGPGDDVGVVTRTIPPDVVVSLNDADIAFLVAETANTDQAEMPQSENWFGHAVARRLGLDPDTVLGRAKVENVIRHLVKGKHIKSVSRRGRNTTDRHKRNLYVPRDQ